MGTTPPGSALNYLHNHWVYWHDLYLHRCGLKSRLYRTLDLANWASIGKVILVRVLELMGTDSTESALNYLHNHCVCWRDLYLHQWGLKIRLSRTWDLANWSSIGKVILVWVLELMGTTPPGSTLNYLHNHWVNSQDLRFPGCGSMSRLNSTLDRGNWPSIHKVILVWVVELIATIPPESALKFLNNHWVNSWDLRFPGCGLLSRLSSTLDRANWPSIHKVILARVLDLICRLCVSLLWSLPNGE